MSFLSGLVPPRHLLGAVAVYYRGSLQYSIVHKLFLGESFPLSPAFQSCLRKRFPPVSSLSGSVPSSEFSTFASFPELSLEALSQVSFLSGSVPPRHLLGALAVYYRGSLQYSIVQKLFLGKSFRPSPAFQSCLWKRFPPVSSLSGSVPSRHLLGPFAVYYRGFHHYSIVQKLFLGKSFPPSPGFQSCLWKRPPPREFPLGFGTIKASSWRCSGLLPEVSPVFDRTETILAKSFRPSPGSQSCLRKRFPP